MDEKEFIQRIERQKWTNEETEEEWWDSCGPETFISIGKKMVEKGFSYEDTLEILGECYSAVSWEYGC